MANQVTDNRTDIADGTVANPGGSGLWEDIGGTALAVDTEITYLSGGSIGLYATTTRDGIFWNAEATGLFSSGDTAYLLFNCGVVGLLDTKALGGVTIRVTGATATDWAEVEIAGSDLYPTAFDGGWVQFVVDIDTLLASPDNTNGTAPTVGNIQRFGVTVITATVMPRMADNTWAGGFRILAANTPAIIIEGRDGGTTDWTWAAVRDVAAVVDSAVIKGGPGGSFVLRGPIQFFIDDASTHAFNDANVSLLWDDQEFIDPDFYGFTQLGAATGTSDLTAGVKTGTGDDATGAQGWIITAAATGQRWFIDVDIANIDSSNWYGCTFQHGADFQLDSATASVISTLFIDCTSARVDNAGDFLRNKIINANTADGVAFITVDDMTDIVFCEFEFSDGHAVMMTTTLVTPQTSKGNKFTNYLGTPGSNLVAASGSNDAAVYNNASGAVTLNITDLGDTPSVRNGASATTTVNNTKTLIVQVDDPGGSPVSGARVRIQEDPGGTLVSQGSTNASGTYTDTGYNFGGDQDVLTKVRLKGFKNFRTGGTITTNGLTVNARFEPDKIVDLP